METQGSCGYCTRDPEHWVPLETERHILPWLASTLHSHSTGLEVDESVGLRRYRSRKGSLKGEYTWCDSCIFRLFIPFLLIETTYSGWFPGRSRNTAIEIGLLLFQILEDRQTGAARVRRDRNKKFNLFSILGSYTKPGKKSLSLLTPLTSRQMKPSSKANPSRHLTEMSFSGNLPAAT